jgi:hypothetical protein
LFVYVAPANIHDSRLFDPVLRNLRSSKNIRIIKVDSAFDINKLYENCKEKAFDCSPRRIPGAEKMFTNLQFPTAGLLSELLEYCCGFVE